MSCDDTNADDDQAEPAQNPIDRRERCFTHRCPRCGSAPGKECRTKSGRVCFSPHKPRVYLVPMVKRHYAFEDDPEEEEEDGSVSVSVTFSPATIRILAQLAERGIYGIGIKGVVEGFVYRGLQDVCRPKEGA